MPCEGDGAPGLVLPRVLTNRDRDFAAGRTVFQPNTLEQLVATVRAAGERRVKAFGSLWAYEQVAITEGLQIATDDLASVLSSWPVRSPDDSASLENMLRDDVKADTTRNFVHVEAGIKLWRLNETLWDDYQMSLCTAGGSAGQSLAGVFSTGSHGSDFDRPPIADYVRAIHLVGPEGFEHWIEPATNPITKGEVEVRSATGLCSDARVHYDDRIFRAALVSLGRFGVIYSVVMEVAPAYHLAHEQGPWGAGWIDLRLRLFNVAIHGDLRREFDSDSVFSGDPAHPLRHVKIHLNPHDPSKAYIHRRWETDIEGEWGDPPITEGPPPQPPTELVLLADVLHPELWLLGMFDFNGDIVSAISNLLFEGEGNNAPALKRQPAYKIMGGGQPAAGSENVLVDSAEFAFNARSTEYLAFLDDVWSAFAAAGRNFGYIAVRFTQKTAALIGMQRWDLTVSVEITSFQGFAGNNVAFWTEIHEAARDRGGIPHWGQHFRLGRSAVDQIYGDDVIDWRLALAEVDGDRPTFRSDTLERLGLDAPMHASRGLYFDTYDGDGWWGSKSTRWGQIGYRDASENRNRRLVALRPRGTESYATSFEQPDDLHKGHMLFRPSGEVLWPYEAFRGGRKFEYGRPDEEELRVVARYWADEDPLAPIAPATVRWYTEIARTRRALNNVAPDHWAPRSTPYFSGEILQLAELPGTDELTLTSGDVFDPRFDETSFAFVRFVARLSWSGQLPDRIIRSRIFGLVRRIDSVPSSGLILNLHTGAVHRPDRTSHFQQMLASFNAVVLPDKPGFTPSAVNIEEAVSSYLEHGEPGLPAPRWEPRRKDFVRLPAGSGWQLNRYGVPINVDAPWRSPLDPHLPTSYVRMENAAYPTKAAAYEAKNRRRARLCKFCFPD